MKAEMILARFRLLISLVVASAALGATFVFAKALREQARNTSRHVPDAEVWIEPRAAGTPDEIAHGRKFYARSCAECHSDDASGDEGPDLRGLPFSNRRVAKIVREGIKGEMPSFRKKYGDKEISSLIAFLRSLPNEDQAVASSSRP